MDGQKLTLVPLPDELQGRDERTILKDMLDRAPSDIDKSEGHMLHDHLAPVAYTLADFVNYDVVLSISMLFPQYAVGQYLDWHGVPISVHRHDATPSVGSVTVVGDPLAVIKKGTVFYTNPTEDGIKYFESTEGVELDEDGVGAIDLISQAGGRDQNVFSGTVVNSDHPSIDTVVNEEPFEGGADREEDDSYRERILDRLRNRAGSGNVNDYKQWAREINGVGQKVIVRRLWDGPKTVKVLITNEDGGMASDELIRKVQDYIDPAEGMGEGKAPIGAHVTVVTVRYVELDIAIEAKTEESCALEMVHDQVREAIDAYARGRSVIRYHSVVGILVNLDCIDDLIDITINGAKEDIELEDEDETAIVGELLINGKAKR